MRTSLMILAALTVSLSVMPSLGQEPADNGAAEQRDEWYFSASGEQPAPLVIIQQKARARAAARINRIETMAAYGMSNARPTANPTPTTLYSPAWQLAGGRPWAWRPVRGLRPVVWR